MTKRHALLLLLILLLLSGCSFFSKSKSNFYSLDRIPPATPPAATAARAVPVAIDALELPPGFDRKEVAVRKADQQLDVRGTDQWSARLQPLVLHTLAFDLADRLPEGAVILPGAIRPAGAARSIDVVFEELAAGPENSLVLDARWVVRSGGTSVAHHDRIAIDLSSLSSKDVAAGLSRALAALADRMAAAL